ncbi:class B sortase [uncultured Clostridium sp.]|uniref:class B sortase n=1 Tax=uncultured Clostridium sp. TaxID=59620 RepID=UPI00260799B5|nr:class B sortase [uncultured Clostridium sp.]
MKKKLLILINISIVVIGLLGASKLLKNFNSYSTANKTYDSVKDIYKDSALPNTENNSDNTISQFEKLYELNNDFKFWLTIENTNIDYPVTQGTDNTFYLNNDFYKKPLEYGSIFLDFVNSFPNDFNNIIYGHNTKNDTMFTTLTDFKKQDFFNQNNKIKISDEFNDYEYEVFSVYTIRGYEDPAFLYTYNSKRSTPTEKLSYLENLKQKSLHKSNTKFQENDKIITLITCSYEASNTRTIVHGKLLKTTPITKK